MNKQAFNKENPVDLFSQLVKVLSRYDDPEIQLKVDELRELSSDIFQLTNRSLQLARLADSILKEAVTLRL